MPNIETGLNRSGVIRFGHWIHINRAGMLRFLSSVNASAVGLMNYKISQNLRQRFRGVINIRFERASAMALLGCTVDECRDYLEGKFKRGMTWENYGTFWEIDHIFPCSKFDLTKESEQMICFHFTNLQPMRCGPNRSKLNKITHPQLSLPL